MSGRLERLVEAVSSRAAMATAAVADLATRYGDAALAGVADLAARYGDEALALASVGAGRVLPGVTAWGVFVVGYLRFSPHLYPTLGEPSEEPGFRAVVAAVALAFALVFAAAFRAANARPAATQAVGVAVLVAGSLAFAAYFEWVAGWDLLDPGDEVFEPLSGFFGEGVLRADVERDLRRSGWRGTAGAAVWLVAFGTFFAIPTMVVGVLTAVLRLLFPLPDLLVLAYVAAGPVRSRLPDLVRETAAAAREGEHRFYQPAAHAGLLEGAALGMLVALGAFGAAGVVGVAVGNTARVASLLALAVPASPLVAWNWLGRLTVLYAAGGYGLWFWLRVARRLPAHLDRRRGEEGAPAVARPRWLTVPPVAAVLAVAASLVAPPPAPAAFAAWPLLVGALWWLVVDARRRDAGDGATDEARVAGAGAGEPDATAADPEGAPGRSVAAGRRLDDTDAVGLGVAVELAGVWTAGRGGASPGALAAQLVLVALAWGLVRASRTGTCGEGGDALPALLVVAGATLVALSALVGPTTALAAVGVGLVVAGGLLAGVRHVER